MSAPISLSELQQLVADGAQLVEVLPEEEYREIHLPGAINIPLKQLTPETAGQLDRERAVVVYCWDGLWDLSPRAACRLETLGFSRVYDYTLGKADWLANNLPLEGTDADAPRAGRLAHDDVVTARLEDAAASLAESIDASPYGFALVVTADRTILGRVRRSALRDAPPDARAEDVMEPGPSTFRADTNPTELAKKLAARGFGTAVISTPEGRLIGVLRCSELT